MSAERSQIVRYLQYVLSIPLEQSVLGPVHNEGIEFAMHWIQNRLDEHWIQEQAVHGAEALIRQLHDLIREGEGDSASADAVREKLGDALATLPADELHRLNELSGNLSQTYIEPSDLPPAS